MKDSNHFKEFFVCPHCGRPLVRIDKIVESINVGERYCGKCGKEIAAALAEAEAKI